MLSSAAWESSSRSIDSPRPAVPFAQHLVDLLRRGHDRLHVEAHQQPQVVHRPEVVRALHRDRDGPRALVEFQGDDLVGVGRLRGQGLDGGVGDRGRVDVDHPHPGLPRQRRHDVPLVDVAEAHQESADRLLAGLLDLEGLVDLVAGHLPHLDQHPTQTPALELAGVGLGLGRLRFRGHPVESSFSAFVTTGAAGLGSRPRRTRVRGPRSEGAIIASAKHLANTSDQINQLDTWIMIR